MNEPAKVEEIPARWRKDVCEVLDCHRDCVIIPRRVQENWEQMNRCDDFAELIYHLCASLSEALKEEGIKGTRIERIGDDKGEIWEFRYRQDENKMYGKISLRLINNKGTRQVYIYSAHIEERAYL